MSERSGWQLSGNAPEAYEQYLIPAWMGAWAQDLVTGARVQRGERVLDVGCGTGVVARQAVQMVGPTGQVVGVDVNAPMLSMAKRLVADRVHGPITWRHGDAAFLPFADATYDVVLCQQGLQYFPDRPTALREMARVLVPDGRLALSVWRPLERYPFFVALVAAIESHLSVEAAGPLRAPFALGEADTLRELVTAAGFREVHVRLEVKMGRYPSIEEFVPGFLSASPLANTVSAMPDVDRKAMVRDVLQPLRSYIDNDGLAAPMECNVVMAHT
jgi:SAM-dependent methyltransferase